MDILLLLFNFNEIKLKAPNHIYGTMKKSDLSGKPAVSNENVSLCLIQGFKVLRVCFCFKKVEIIIKNTYY